MRCLLQSSCVSPVCSLFDHDRVGDSSAWSQKCYDNEYFSNPCSIPVAYNLCVRSRADGNSLDILSWSSLAVFLWHIVFFMLGKPRQAGCTHIAETLNKFCCRLTASWHTASRYTNTAMWPTLSYRALQAILLYPTVDCKGHRRSFLH